MGSVTKKHSKKPVMRKKRARSMPETAKPRADRLPAGMIVNGQPNPDGSFTFSVTLPKRLVDQGKTLTWSAVDRTSPQGDSGNRVMHGSAVVIFTDWFSMMIPQRLL